MSAAQPARSSRQSLQTLQPAPSCRARPSRFFAVPRALPRTMGAPRSRLGAAAGRPRTMASGGSGPDAPGAPHGARGTKERPRRVAPKLRPAAAAARVGTSTARGGQRSAALLSCGAAAGGMHLPRTRRAPPAARTERGPALISVSSSPRPSLRAPLPPEPPAVPARPSRERLWGEGAAALCVPPARPRCPKRGPAAPLPFPILSRCPPPLCLFFFFLCIFFPLSPLLPVTPASHNHYQMGLRRGCAAPRPIAAPQHAAAAAPPTPHSHPHPHPPSLPPPDPPGASGSPRRAAAAQSPGPARRGGAGRGAGTAVPFPLPPRAATPLARSFSGGWGPPGGRAETGAGLAPTRLRVPVPLPPPSALNLSRPARLPPTLLLSLPSSPPPPAQPLAN